MTPSAKTPPTPGEAYSRLADRCAMTEISTGEALEKLRRMGLRGPRAEAIVQRLVDERFIDDERFARAWVRDRFGLARWGRRKIRESLILKRVDSAIIRQALEEEIDPEAYYENLADALRSKARGMSEPLTREERMKLARFAASRGYEPDLIMEMIADEDYWRGETD